MVFYLLVLQRKNGGSFEMKLYYKNQSLPLSMKIFISLFFILLQFNISAQSNSTFCKAVEKQNFKKIERMVKRKVNQNSSGTQFYNGPGSGMQTSFLPNMDKFCAWLTSYSCVDTAVYDKCETKISIYPGWFVLGANFKTKTSTFERSFYIQAGTTGNLNFLGFRFHAFQYQEKLVYKKMYERKDFVKNQLALCDEEKQRAEEYRRNQNHQITLNKYVFSEKDSIKLIVNGNFMLDGSCGSDKLIWYLERANNRGKFQEKEYELIQMDCGLSSKSFENEEIEFIELNSDAKPTPKTYETGIYRIVLFKNNTEKVYSPSFELK